MKSEMEKRQDARELSLLENEVSMGPMTEKEQLIYRMGFNEGCIYEIQKERDKLTR